MMYIVLYINIYPLVYHVLAKRVVSHLNDVYSPIYKHISVSLPCSRKEGCESFE